MRRGFQLGLLLSLSVAGLIAGCGKGGKSGGSTPPGFVGLVFGYDEAPARGQVATFVETGSPSATVGPDGRFFFSGVNPGTHVLKVGDSKTTPTFFLPVTVDAPPSFLPRPIFLPSLESGITDSVTGGLGTAQIISSTKLDGVALLIGSSTSVSFPATAANRQLTIVGVSPSRLPVALPDGVATRAAYAIEPRGVRFGPAVSLTVPRLDASTDPLELYKLDDNGLWRTAGTISSVTTDSITVTIDEGALYAVAPRTPGPTTTITGRIVAGGRILEGYRVECWNKVSAPTKADGRFTIEKVPSGYYPALLLRPFPARPGIDFAPEIATYLVAAGATDAGDLVVSAPPPITVRPKVLATQPADGAIDQSPFTSVSVQFSNAVNPSTVRLQLKGLRGPVTGRTFLANAFTAIFVPASPLDAGDTFSILVDEGITDAAGNFIDDSSLLFRFTVAAGITPATPTDQKIFGMSPLEGDSSTLVTIFGRNFAGGSVVTVGGGRAQVRQETAMTLQFLPPVAEPGSLANVAVTNSAQTNVSSLAPLSFDLRPSVASLSSGTILRSKPPTSLYAIGDNVSRGRLTVEGVVIATVDSTEPVGGVNVVVSLDAAVGTTRIGQLLTGPVVVRGTHGKPGSAYRFVHVGER
jgi:hypothetical protein